MSKLRRWVPSILCLLVVWLGVSVAVRMVSSGKPSAAATLKLLDEWPGAAGNAERRQAWIALISSRLSHLNLDSRHLVLMDSGLRSVFLEMSPEDQAYFLTATQPPKMKELVEGSKRWSSGRCVRLMEPALADLEELKTGSAARFKAMLVVDLAIAEPAIEKVGIEAVFKRPADPLTRFDTRPFIERIQKYAQMGR